MKKIVFTLMTLVALVVMAGSAMAQNETTVLPGGTYTYNLTGVYSFNEATAVVTYSGTGETILEQGGSFTIAAATTSTVSFTIEYGTQAAPATSGTITVEITDGTSTCVNSIELDITVSPLPAYTLTIAKDETGYDDCQARNGVSNNSADALGTDIAAEENSFTFTVTPVVTGVTGNFDYSYTIDLPDGSGLNSYTIVDGAGNAVSDGTISYTGVSSVVGDEFTVKFNTTTGIDTKALVASLTLSTSLLEPVDGGGQYQATMASGGSLTQTVNVNAVPTIGSFE